MGVEQYPKKMDEHPALNDSDTNAMLPHPDEGFRDWSLMSGRGGGATQREGGGM